MMAHLYVLYTNTYKSSGTLASVCDLFFLDTARMRISWNCLLTTFVFLVSSAAVSVKNMHAIIYACMHIKLPIDYTIVATIAASFYVPLFLTGCLTDS